VFGIFTIMCPDCGAPVDQGDPVAGTADGDVATDGARDVLVCAECASTFVVRFGHALAVSPSADAGAA
jgi:hypothetical protein